MKSLAIWKDNQEVIIKDIHVNVWKLPCEKGKDKQEFKRVIDFGFMFDFKGLGEFNEEEDSIELNIFYPQIIDKKDITDLVKTLYLDIESKLISTLFNDNLNLQIDSNSDFAKVTNGDVNKDFFTYKLKEDNISVGKFKDGVIIKISFKLISKVKNEKLYIRFRINKDYSDTFCTISKPANEVLQSQFSKTELFNFRINEVRDISNEVLEKININKLVRFERILFFYICSTSDEYLYSHKPYSGLRILEKDKWNTYIGDDVLNNTNNILAYQFKETAKKEGGNSENVVLINDYNFLFQTKYDHNNKKTIWKYLLYLFLITLSFNLISNFIWSFGIEGLTLLLGAVKFLYDIMINLSAKAISSMTLFFVIVLVVINWKRIKTLWKQFF